ncbi:MAG: glycosyltransferase [Oscillospiraceae bacterium]|jgi:glycosyltransferase involved in cell wall biosynthesis|nr:glycosyltransferase [Oscillospiraceae bacterium]
MISVIIPVYNQYPSLDATLWHFCRQTTSEPFEIIIVDDGSLDYEPSVINNYNSLKIKYIKNKTNKGRAYTRNIAIDISKGEFIIFCDCDRLPVPNFIESHMNLIDSQDAILSIGYLTETYDSIDKLKVNTEKIIKRKSIYYKVISQIYDESGKTDSHLCWLSTLSGNMALKKSTLAEHRFDCDFKSWGFEHFELGYRLKKDNVVFMSNEKAENIHIAHLRNSGFYKDHVNSSHQIFFNKHPFTEVSLFKKFILGDISLQEYETKINGGENWMKNKYKPIMINYVNI